MLSLVHVLQWRAAVSPEAVALTDHQGARLTYAGLAAAMQRSAAGFAAAGVAPGIPDDRWGETVHAVVVAAPGLDPAGLDGGALVSWARERLAGFKCPTGITIVSELPRNATGKVLRATLREPFWAGRDRQVS